jgi:hypothetical protein
MLPMHGRSEAGDDADPLADAAAEIYVLALERGLSDRLLKPAEAARLLGIKTETLMRGWRRRGWIEAVRLPNGHARFRLEAVMQAAARPRD